jgi:hypothetical protein
VKRATRKSDGKQFAIKVIKKSKLNSEELAVVHDEVEIMHKVNHPNCVQLFEMFETTKKMYMVLELLTGGELFDRIVKKGSYSEKEASDVIKSVVSALQYLHDNGIVHRGRDKRGQTSHVGAEATMQFAHVTPVAHSSGVVAVVALFLVSRRPKTRKLDLSVLCR